MCLLCWPLLACNAACLRTESPVISKACLGRDAPSGYGHSPRSITRSQYKARLAHLARCSLALLEPRSWHHSHELGAVYSTIQYFCAPAAVTLCDRMRECVCVCVRVSERANELTRLHPCTANLVPHRWASACGLAWA